MKRRPEGERVLDRSRIVHAIARRPIARVRVAPLAVARIHLLLGYGRAAFNHGARFTARALHLDRTHMNRRRKYATGAGLALLVVTALPMGPQPVDAADHKDAPGTQADP